MRLIVAGSRTFFDKFRVGDILDPMLPEITEVVCGMAIGADLMGKEWARKNNIPVKEYPANWVQYGKSAGYKRNLLMAENADALVAFWDGKSRGTMHMINIAKDKGLAVTVIPI